MKKEAVPASGPVATNDIALELARGRKRRILMENLELWSFVIPAGIFIIIFNYIPLYGILIAFQDYFPGKPFLAFDGSTAWCGLKHIIKFTESIYFGRIVGNTIRLSLLHLCISFWVPIIFALILNEIKALTFKKFIQTCSYLPYFISTVVVAAMFITFLEPTGILNRFLSLFGVKPKAWLDSSTSYPWIYTLIQTWKSFGFSSVLYFSTLSAIDPTLYESARIDGANRRGQMWHITLPGLKSIIMIQFILAIGGILNSNTDLTLLIYSPATYATSDVIGTYVYREGIEGGKYSYSTAVSLFLSVIGFTLTFFANKLSNWLTGFGLW